jgi:hypothetical protein
VVIRFMVVDVIRLLHLLIGRALLLHLLRHPLLLLRPRWPRAVALDCLVCSNSINDK